MPTSVNFQDRLCRLILDAAPFPVRNMVALKAAPTAVTRWLALHPERILGDTDRVSLGNLGPLLSRPADGFPSALAFHGLSPCGDSLSLLASIGRDVSVGAALGVEKLQYCVQGPARAELNSSISRILAAWPAAARSDLIHADIRARRDFLALVSGAAAEASASDTAGLPELHVRVVDFEPSTVVDEVYPVARTVERAWDVVDRIFGSDREALADMSRACVTAALTRYERTSDGRHPAGGSTEAAYLLRSLNGLLGVAPRITDDSLRYYFTEHECMKAKMGPNSARFGPPEERNWDGPFSTWAGPDTAAGQVGVYTRKYAVRESWGLPYSHVAGNTISAITEVPAAVDDLLFVGDTDPLAIRGLLASADRVESRRFLADLASFAVVAARATAEGQGLLQRMPYPMSRKANWILPGSPSTHAGYMRPSTRRPSPEASTSARRTSCPIC